MAHPNRSAQRRREPDGLTPSPIEGNGLEAGVDLIDGTPFLNRIRELAGLQAALRRTLAGRGGLLLVSGEGGIGKTRLVSELTTRAVAPGADGGAARVLWGRCWDGGGAPSMWPWVGVLRDLFASLDADALRDQLASAAPWLAPLVPELRDALPELDGTPAPDSEQSRFVLFDALSGVLRRASATAPLVIVLDDIHAADQLSLLALLFVARQLPEMRVLMIATYRDTEVQARSRHAGVFAKLVRVSERVPLSGLEAGEIGRLIEHRGGAGDPDLAAMLQQATGGNPFFADEVLRSLHSEGRLESLTDRDIVPLPVPIGVRALIEERLVVLPASARQAICSAAVIGGEFSLATLRQVTAMAREELMDALELSLEARLIEPRAGEVAGYRFVHDLIRETAYESLRPADRARTHAAVGDALERRYAGTSELHLEELAHHFLEALPGGNARIALEYARRAADHAMARFAHERSARLYTAALGALELVEELDPGERLLERARVLLGLGRAQLRIADGAARGTLLEAAAAARAAGSASDLADVALTFGAFALSPGLVDPELTGLLEEALAVVAPQDSPVRAHLLARLARALYWAPERQRGRELIDEAVAMARRLGDPEALARVLGNCIPASRGPDTAELELGWIYELLSLSRTPGELFVLARSIEIDLLLERGALAAADAAIDSLETEAERLRDVRARPYVALHRARRATLEGRWDDAERLITEVARVASDLQDSTVPILSRGALFMLRVMQGRPQELAADVHRIADALPEMHIWRAGVALTSAVAGERDAAQALLDRLAADELSAIPRNNVWLITVAVLADVCVRLGDRRHAELLHRALLPFAEWMAVSPVNGHLGPVARYLGLLEALMGDSAAAEAHLRGALERARQDRLVPLVAMTALDLAVTLSGPGEPGAEARELTDEADRLARELELAPLVERVAELRTTAGTRPQASIVDPTRASLVLEGEIWRFRFEGRTLLVRDSKGIRHVAELLSQPGIEVHALYLGRNAAVGALTDAAAVAGELTISAPSVGAGPALDGQAKADYRRRIEDLREELEEAERWNDPERVRRAREEIEFLGRELAAAVGIGGRDRPQASDAERARVNVTRAIKTAIRRIAERDVELGAELEATIHTGLFCRHEPDVRRPVRWEVHGG